MRKRTNEVADFLRKLRFENNESQTEMAVRVGTSMATISLAEARAQMTSSLARKIINAYSLNDSDKKKFTDIVSRAVLKRYWGQK
jgi:transcriptional regulator with XRE-family HTH domain